METGGRQIIPTQLAKCYIAVCQAGGRAGVGVHTRREIRFILHLGLQFRESVVQVSQVRLLTACFHGNATHTLGSVLLKSRHHTVATSQAKRDYSRGQGWHPNCLSVKFGFQLLTTKLQTHFENTLSFLRSRAHHGALGEAVQAESSNPPRGPPGYLFRPLLTYQPLPLHHRPLRLRFSGLGCFGSFFLFVRVQWMCVCARPRVGLRGGRSLRTVPGRVKLQSCLAQASHLSPGTEAERLLQFTKITSWGSRGLSLHLSPQPRGPCFQLPDSVGHSLHPCADGRCG